MGPQVQHDHGGGGGGKKCIETNF